MSTPSSMLRRMQLLGCLPMVQESDDLSIASCSSFDQLVNEVLDGEDAATVPLLTTTSQTTNPMEMINFPTNSMPRRITDQSLTSKIDAHQASCSNNDLPFESLKRFAASKQSERPATKQKTTKPDPRRWKSRPRPIQALDTGTTLLHQVCCQSSVTAAQVQEILKADPEAVRRRSAGMPTMEYQYPLNLAIANKASASVIRFLIRADASIASRTDGPACEGSLHILLRQRRSDVLSLVGSVLLANPESAKVSDSRWCLPLHAAVLQQQMDLDTIRHLTTLFPEALHMRNRNHQTPIDVATHMHVTCSEDVSVYLWGALDCEPEDI